MGMFIGSKLNTAFLQRFICQFLIHLRSCFKSPFGISYPCNLPMKRITLQKLRNWRSVNVSPASCTSGNISGYLPDEKVGADVKTCEVGMELAMWLSNSLNNNLFEEKMDVRGFRSGYCFWKSRTEKQKLIFQLIDRQSHTLLLYFCWGYSCTTVDC